jgi:hypothetical protein
MPEARRGQAAFSHRVPAPVGSFTSSAEQSAPSRAGGIRAAPPNAMPGDARSRFFFRGTRVPQIRPIHTEVPEDAVGVAAAEPPRALCSIRAARQTSRAASRLSTAMPSPTIRSGHAECTEAVNNPAAMIATFASAPLRAERAAMGRGPPGRERRRGAGTPFLPVALRSTWRGSVVSRCVLVGLSSCSGVCRRHMQSG